MTTLSASHTSLQSNIYLNGRLCAAGGNHADVNYLKDVGYCGNGHRVYYHRGYGWSHEMILKGTISIMDLMCNEIHQRNLPFAHTMEWGRKKVMK